MAWSEKLANIRDHASELGGRIYRREPFPTSPENALDHDPEKQRRVGKGAPRARRAHAAKAAEY